MKKAIYILMALTAVMFLMAGAVDAQTYVEKWGKTAQGSAWPILNTATTPPGNATMGAGAIPTGWATIRGEFNEALQATVDKAVVIRGKLELVGGGGGSNYTHLRYALTFQDSTKLEYQFTDSAKWVSTKGHSGYGFHPRSGTGVMSNGNGGSGTVWTINNGSWSSTWSNNGGPIAAVKQAPRDAEMVAGMYNWAISVHLLESGATEVRWYMVEENNKYWFGGKVVDNGAASSKFNGVCFGINKDTECKQLNLYEVQVDMGDPIEVPEAPWEPFYVNQWGKTNRGTAWPILNDESYLDGDAGIGSGAPPSGWATIRGGFADVVTATQTKAIIVKGKLELVGGGGGSGYTHLRYALTYQDSVELRYQNTDSARWYTTGTVDRGHYGYEFTPRSGMGTIANGTNGVGTVWSVKDAWWNSTYNANIKPLVIVKQAPRDAEMVAGMYDWAISVRPLGDGTNEVRWYMVEENNKYWFGGVVIDPEGVATKFNGICFGFNNDTKATRVNLYEVMVDMGDPIEVPEAPWEPFYVNQWGKTNRGTAWPILNDESYLDGDAGIGSGAPPSGWATIRGGFADVVTATQTKAIIVKGKLELVGGGGGSGYTHLRYALTYQDSVELRYQNTDSARWYTTGTVDRGHYGYEFTPRSGMGTIANGTNGVGTVWSVKDAWWNSTYNANIKPLVIVKQAPRDAEMVAGMYDWAISVRPLGDGTNEVRWYMVEENNKYWFGGVVIDPEGVATKFNGICFGFNNDTKATRVNLYEVMVDMGDPIEVPEAPWEAFYVTEWGFIGGNIGGWKFTPGDFDGDAMISGTVPATSWSALQGGFGDVVKPKAGKALKVTGKIILVGGGFESAGSLRFGIFNSTTSGNLITTNVDSTRWSGVDPKHTGYLFIPVSGNNDLTKWSGINQKGSYGAVIDHAWLIPDGVNDYVLGTNFQRPEGAVGSAGTYEFGISIQPLSDGRQEVRAKLIKTDGSYAWAVKTIDFHVPNATDQFNCINFALDQTPSTTALKVEEVQVDLGDPLDLPEWVVAVEPPKPNEIPTTFALSQNYPNPFNPTTTIEFAIAQNTKVSLVVYNTLGKIVAELANGLFNPGRYQITFDAAHLSSGVYFYQLRAGDFQSTKKLMLVK